MKTFYIIANSDKEESLRLAEQAKRYLTERGQVCVVRGQEQEHGNAHCELPSGNVDGILVLGGDGTLLRAARELAGRKIPSGTSGISGRDRGAESYVGTGSTD